MEALRTFVQQRKAFNHSFLARESQWDKLDFSRWIRNKTDIMPKRVENRLIRILTEYGFKA